MTCMRPAGQASATHRHINCKWARWKNYYGPNHSLVTHRKAKRYARTGHGTQFPVWRAKCGWGNHFIRSCGLANRFVKASHEAHFTVNHPSYERCAPPGFLQPTDTLARRNRHVGPKLRQQTIIQRCVESQKERRSYLHRGKSLESRSALTATAMQPFTGFSSASVGHTTFQTRGFQPQLNDHA